MIKKCDICTDRDMRGGAALYKCGCQCIDVSNHWWYEELREGEYQLIISREPFEEDDEHVVLIDDNYCVMDEATYNMIETKKVEDTYIDNLEGGEVWKHHCLSNYSERWLNLYGYHIGCMDRMCLKTYVISIV